MKIERHQKGNKMEGKHWGSEEKEKGSEGEKERGEREKRVRERRESDVKNKLDVAVSV